MQVFLTPHTEQLIEQMKALGYYDTAALIEVALERMAQEELADSEQESPEIIEWMQREVEFGAEQLERREFSTLSLNEIKAEVLAEYQQRHS